MSSFNAVLAGVGGQGIVLASRVLIEDALKQGHSVRGSETHGMAQRGGPVVAHVRTGACHSPMVSPTTAHLLIALERMEGLRNLAFPRPGGIFLVNSPDLGFLDPPIAAYLKRYQIECLALDASSIAASAGSPRSVNMILLGAAAALRTAPFDLDGLQSALAQIVSHRALEMNLEAMSIGHQRADKLQRGA